MAESPTEKTSILPTSRREFLFAISALVGGMVVGATRGTAQSAEPSPGLASHDVTAWISIGSDDTVVIRVARSDMGQGILTALPMLVAEELECNWSHVRTEFVSASENVLHDHRWGAMVATNSISIRSSQAYLRKAGAQARSMLIAEAAARWNVPAEECSARDGVIRSEEHTSELQSP